MRVLCIYNALLQIKHYKIIHHKTKLDKAITHSVRVRFAVDILMALQSEGHHMASIYLSYLRCAQPLGI